LTKVLITYSCVKIAENLSKQIKTSYLILAYLSDRLVIMIDNSYLLL